METYAETGQVRFEYKNYAFLGTESSRSAEAALCANDQGKFWPYHDVLFANQKGENIGTFSDTALKNFAVAAALDQGAFNKCFDSGQYRQTVRLDLIAGQERDVGSTPTVFFNGEALSGAPTFERLQALIEAELGNAP
jgi:protein-disulfide isomerase